MRLSPTGEAEPSKAPRQLRIVVADDDRDTVLTLMMLLRAEGHDVRGVHSGRYVMGAVLDMDPDVVILDIKMPELSGWEVARTIRARKDCKQPTLIGISGEYKMGSDKILSEILGFDYYLLKPYDPNVLLALIAPLTLPSPTGQ
jgi:DNA-binding response OmpR family regulator